MIFVYGSQTLPMRLLIPIPVLAPVACVSIANVPSDFSQEIERQRSQIGDVRGVSAIKRFLHLIDVGVMEASLTTDGILPIYRADKIWFPGPQSIIARE